MDGPSTFGICLFFSFTRKKICACKHFGIKASSAWVLVYDFPFSKQKRLYKLELNLDMIQLILQPFLRGGMACLSIFGGEILTYLCLVCSRESQIYFHVSRFISHFRVWTSINGMCKRRRFGFLNSFPWTCSTRLKRLEWLINDFVYYKPNAPCNLCSTFTCKCWTTMVECKKNLIRTWNIYCCKKEENQEETCSWVVITKINTRTNSGPMSIPRSF